MAKKCEVCNKGPLVGNNVSHANNRTKRRYLPNLQNVKVKRHGNNISLRICTSCLRSGKV